MDWFLEHHFLNISDMNLAHTIFFGPLFPIGTIAPTSSPAFSSLADVGGCPLDYSSDGGYEAGDKVSLEGNGVEKIVYECKAFPDSGYCNQYEPGHWSKLGWMLVGYCEGKFMAIRCLFTTKCFRFMNSQVFSHLPSNN